MAKAPSPAREARALPGVRKQLRKWYSGSCDLFATFHHKIKIN